MSITRAGVSRSDGPRTASQTRQKPLVRKTGSQKIGTDLVLLSTVAILSVYGIGYQRTLAGADAIAGLDSTGMAQTGAEAATPTPIATAIAAVAARVGLAQTPSTSPVGSALGTPPSITSTPRVAATATAAPKIITPTPADVKSGQFRDGTYVGQGFSRHGGIEATVIVAGGKIVSANITSCSTRYPCSDVEPLIPEVVTRQAAPIHHVSGATDSSNAYRDAVIKAVSRAV